jgi:urease accessory protein UreF
MQALTERLVLVGLLLRDITLEVAAAQVILLEAEVMVAAVAALRAIQTGQMAQQILVAVQVELGTSMAQAAMEEQAVPVSSS